MVGSAVQGLVEVLLEDAHCNDLNGQYQLAAPMNYLMHEPISSHLTDLLQKLIKLNPRLRRVSDRYVLHHIADIGNVNDLWIQMLLAWQGNVLLKTKYNEMVPVVYAAHNYKWAILSTFKKANLSLFAEHAKEVFEIAVINNTHISVEVTKALNHTLSN
jgi:hypothetical protein